MSLIDNLRFTFGKHKGRSFADVADDDLLYLDWLIGQDWFLAKYHTYAAVIGTICRERADEIDQLLTERDHDR